MNSLLPETYLIGLIGLLLIIAVLVGRQLLRVRRDEGKLIQLEKNTSSNSKDAADLYELASVQLRKRLYPQATTTLQKALKILDEEPEEAKALIENALGFSLAAQDDFESAIRHYRTALKAKEDYPVALNNLAFAKERLQQSEEAQKLYKQVLDLDPKNKTAKRQLRKMANKQSSNSPDGIDNRGF